MKHKQLFLHRSLILTVIRFFTYFNSHSVYYCFWS